MAQLDLYRGSWIPKMIISGGQTGADRGGLDAAISLGIPHGGHCPRGRAAEDGRIPSSYNLMETENRGYISRTRLNVMMSDATVIFLIRPATPGSRETYRIANEAGKRVHVTQPLHHNMIQFESFLDLYRPNILNVAGSRESKSPGIQLMVEEFLWKVLR